MSATYEAFFKSIKEHLKQSETLHPRRRVADGGRKVGTLKQNQTGSGFL